MLAVIAGLCFVIGTAMRCGSEGCRPWRRNGGGSIGIELGWGGASNGGTIPCSSRGRNADGRSYFYVCAARIDGWVPALQLVYSNALSCGYRPAGVVYVNLICGAGWRQASELLQQRNEMG